MTFLGSAISTVPSASMLALQLGSDVVLVQPQHLEPVAAAVLERPGDEPDVLGGTLPPLRGERADAPHLLLVRGRVEDVTGARGDQVDHREALPSPSPGP